MLQSETLIVEAVQDLVRDEVKNHIRQKLESDPELKDELKRAVESLFRVKVLSVRTLTVNGKKKRVGRFIGHTPGWKKAVATLKAGESIEFFEGV